MSHTKSATNGDGETGPKVDFTELRLVKVLKIKVALSMYQDNLSIAFSVGVGSRCVVCLHKSSVHLILT